MEGHVEWQWCKQWDVEGSDAAACSVECCVLVQEQGEASAAAAVAVEEQFVMLGVRGSKRGFRTACSISMKAMDTEVLFNAIGIGIAEQDLCVTVTESIGLSSCMQLSSRFFQRAT